MTQGVPPAPTRFPSLCCDREPITAVCWGPCRAHLICASHLSLLEPSVVKTFVSCTLFLLLFWFFQGKFSPRYSILFSSGSCDFFLKVSIFVVPVTGIYNFSFTVTITVVKEECLSSSIILIYFIVCVIFLYYIFDTYSYLYNVYSHIICVP